MQLQFKVENDHIKLLTDISVFRPVSDSINHLKATFEFDEVWQGFKKIALFSYEKGEYKKELKNNICVVPWEVLTRGYFSVSVYGLKDDIRITVTGVRIPLDLSGFTAADLPTEPTKTLEGQILDDLSALNEEVEDIKSTLDGVEGISVDDKMSDTSENAVQNKVVKEYVDESIKDKTTTDEMKSYVDKQTNIIKSDVEGLQQQLNEEAHFRGYVSTNAKIQEMEATPNDFAYSAESGTKWIYDEVDGWQDSGTPVPDQLTPASETTPLINGEASVGKENAYARGDHRHPTDTTRASIEYVNQSIQQAILDSWEVEV